MEDTIRNVLEEHGAYTKALFNALMEAIEEN